MHWIGAVGRLTLSFPLYLYALTLFTLRALSPWQAGRLRFNLASYRTLLGQLIFTGIDALPVLSLLALGVGMAVTLPLILALQPLMDPAEIITLLIRVVVYELATLLTAVILLVRTASAIVVDLGGMKLHRELEALEMLGVRTHTIFLAPRILGVGLAQMLLATYCAGLALVSGLLLLALVEHVGYLSFLHDVARAFHPLELLFFLLKNLAFGLLMASIACYHALQVEHSPTELPQQTQRALIYALSWIFVFNGVMALLSWTS